MIVEVSISNYLSVAEEQTLSFLADDNSDVLRGNCSSFKNDKMDIVRSAVLYGANASGKTNVLQGIVDIKNMVLKSGSLKIDDSIPAFKPFLLDPNFENKNTIFEIEFYSKDLYEDKKRRYNFLIEFNKYNIVLEKLSVFRTSKSSIVYERALGQKIKSGGYLKGSKKRIADDLLDNQLFLSVAGNAKDHPLNGIYRYFRDKIIPIGSLDILSRKNLVQGPTPNQLIGDKADYYIEEVGKMLNAVDVGIDKIYVKNVEVKIELPESIPLEVRNEFVNSLKHRTVAVHSKYEKGRRAGVVEFDFLEESAGTQHFVNLAVDFVDVLNDGGTLIVDELDASLHPEVLKFVVQLFGGSGQYDKFSQIVFSTHDVSILSPKLFRRDQVWFTEKDQYGATHLFSLLEFDKSAVRKDTNFGDWYLKGKFGAIPIINKSLVEVLCGE